MIRSFSPRLNWGGRLILSRLWHLSIDIWGLS